MTAIGSRYQREAIERVLSKLGPNAALRSIVDGEVVQQTLAKYEAADSIALYAQARYRSWARRGLRATTFGILVGAILLLPLDNLLNGYARGGIGLLQTLALLVTFGAMAFVTWLRPLDQWMSHRAVAERLRGEIFDNVIGGAPPAGMDAAGLAGDKLALLLEAYVHDQLRFFEKRSSELRRAASKVSPIRVTAYSLIIVASVLGFAALIKAASIVLPGWLVQLAETLALADANRWQLGITTIASGLLAYTTARTLMDEDERKAALYTVTAAKLNGLLQRELPAVQAATAEGDEDAVGRLYLAARQILEQEHAVWSYIRERDNEDPAEGQASGLTRSI